MPNYKKVRRLNNRFKKFWVQDKSLTILLIILVVHIFIVIPFAQPTVFSRFVFIVFYFSILATGMNLLIKNALLRYVFISILALLAFLGSGLMFKSVTLQILNNSTIALYSILLSWVVLLRTFRKGHITIHRVQGAVIVYLLIGLFFGMLYYSIALISEKSAFNGFDTLDRMELMYFSLTTLTTVGYGDITPALPMTKSLANLEALIGQLYPVILIARLVSMEYESSRKA